MEQEEVRTCASHRSWYCWRTIPLLRHGGCDFDVFGTSDDADLGARLAHFMDEADRR